MEASGRTPLPFVRIVAVCTCYDEEGESTIVKAGTSSKPIMGLKLSRKVCLCSITLRDTTQCKRTCSTLSFAPQRHFCSSLVLSCSAGFECPLRTRNIVFDNEKLCRSDMNSVDICVRNKRQCFPCSWR